MWLVVLEVRVQSLCSACIVCFLDPQTTTHIHFADDMCHVYIWRPATNIKTKFQIMLSPHLLFMNTMSNILFPNSRMQLLGLCTISISVCSGQGGSVPGRNRVPGTGSKFSFRNRFWFRTCSGFKSLRARGFDCFGVRLGSETIGCVPKVWTEVVLGTGFREPEVLRRFRVPEIPFPRFRQLLCTSKVYFCILKVHSYFCTLKVYF